MGWQTCVAWLKNVPSLVLATVALVPFLLLSLSQSAPCADGGACRQAALDAAARGDFETFHDLAWRAAQKGRPNDPELMYLLARAQSLSGRPSDALVMLRRLAQMGVRTDARDNADFERVRGLPAWPELEALIDGASTTAQRSERALPGGHAGQSESEVRTGDNSVLQRRAGRASWHGERHAAERERDEPGRAGL
jgi:hypothetical protein